MSLSCVKRPDGSPMILCSVGFYHDSLEQLWIRDGDVLNSSYSNKSFNGSFNQKSYLILPPQTFTDTIYSCWVNHSSLNKPLVASLSSSVCYERGGVTVNVVFIVSSMLAVFLIIAVMCKRYRGAGRRSVSAVGVSVTPEPVLHAHLQSEMLYSTLVFSQIASVGLVERVSDLTKLTSPPQTNITSSFAPSCVRTASTCKMQKRTQFPIYEMISSKCNSVTTFALMLLSFFSVIDGHTEFNGTLVQTVDRGKSVNISCNYKPSSDIESFTVKLETTNTLCSVMYVNKSWINHSCKALFRFIWIPKRVEMSFEVSNLQINDTDIYKCVVTRNIPPPSVPLREERTFVQVIAHPNVSVSHVRASDGFHEILCRSEGFYPSFLKLVWMRNGGFQNISHTYNINKTNPDGSFTLHSYLNVSDCTNYSCWVNHSSLSQPTILHLSPADCYENRESFRDKITWMTLMTCVLLILAILIMTVVCERFTISSHVLPERARRRSASAVGVSFTPEPVLHAHLQTEIVYSTLGDHHPVPCSPVGVRSFP
ncbi:uncharacterized protein LOC125262734 isoform X2 [Megalobrama amblycephala]|uniref:uncharacterized protein LOC125262734 isoform X2 n=1 Tax=Megalobrama amblycephala TaxID=75352 RepID=UPI00201461E9|nr:uncharacterized protein LOC125262734 isoform X2 [Megalobrama amblycephala]